MPSAELQACLGGTWPPPCALDAEVTEVEHPQGEAFTRERLSYAAEPGERVPAFLLIPSAANVTPCPAIVLCHQHAGQYDIGKSEPAGLAGDPMHHTGVALARQGFIVLCPDALCFEERGQPRKVEDRYAAEAIVDEAAPEAFNEGGLKTGEITGGDLERFEFLRYVVNGQSLAWKSVLDFKRSVDYLVSRPEVAANRIGTYGHSMGSTHVWLGTPHDPRVIAAVGNCCMPSCECSLRTRTISHPPEKCLNGLTDYPCGRCACTQTHQSTGTASCTATLTSSLAGANPTVTYPTPSPRSALAVSTQAIRRC